MRTIRASEIAGYLYCQRAWWYRLQGFESQNQAEFASGVRIHARHARTVFVSGFFRTLAMLALLASLVLLAVYFTSLIL